MKKSKKKMKTKIEPSDWLKISTLLVGEPSDGDRDLNGETHLWQMDLHPEEPDFEPIRLLLALHLPFQMIFD
jgi:hypothetical protein